MLGKEHSETLVSLGSLAVILFNQRKYEEAEQICRRTAEVYASYSKVFGPDDPKSLWPLLAAEQLGGGFARPWKHFRIEGAV